MPVSVDVSQCCRTRPSGNGVQVILAAQRSLPSGSDLPLSTPAVSAPVELQQAAGASTHVWCHFSARRHRHEARSGEKPHRSSFSRGATLCRLVSDSRRRLTGRARTVHRPAESNCRCSGAVHPGGGTGAGGAGFSSAKPGSRATSASAAAVTSGNRTWDMMFLGRVKGRSWVDNGAATSATLPRLSPTRS